MVLYYEPPPATEAERRLAARIFARLYAGDLYASGEGHREAMEGVARMVLQGRVDQIVGLTRVGREAIDYAMQKVD